MTLLPDIQQSNKQNHPQVIGFGALNLDRIFYVDRIVKPDEEGFINSVENHPGGSAANTIVGLARLGILTGFIGKIASDDSGKILLDNLKSEGVNTSEVSIANGRSGVCLIMVDYTGNRGILVDPGVNDFISWTDVNMDYINSARLIHMTSFICKESDTPFNTQKAVAEHTTARISLDPGTLYAERGIDELIEFIHNGGIILPNDHELELMTGCRDVSKGADMLLDAGAAWVAVKMGEVGCYVTDGVLRKNIPSKKVIVVDTTGAGDAFNAGFLYSMLQGKDIEVCGTAGNTTASYSIAHKGARKGLLHTDQLQKAIKGLLD